MYEIRTYRNLIKTDDLVKFEVIVKETDLLIRSERNLYREARDSIIRYRHQIETYIEMNPEFKRSLVPLEDDPKAPEIIREMLHTSQLANVGPMASVAGAIAESVSKDLIKFSRDVIIENGGDIYLYTSKERIIGIYAGNSPFSLKIGILIEPEDSPIGICTSSGTVGHSISFGRADAVTILSKSGALADASATAIGNLVRRREDIEQALEKGKEIKGVLGILVIIGDKLGVWGNINLIKI